MVAEEIPVYRGQVLGNRPVERVGPIEEQLHLHSSKISDIHQKISMLDARVVAVTSGADAGRPACAGLKQTAEIVRIDEKLCRCNSALSEVDERLSSILERLIL
jgi:hypothetical protein